MTPKNPYSIKATVYTNGRKRELDGPWRSTVQFAVNAFAEQLQKAGLGNTILFRPFVAERCEAADAPMADTKGNYYRECPTSNLNDLLTAAGLRTDPTRPTT